RFHAMQSIILSAFMIFVGAVVYFGIWFGYVNFNNPVWNVVSIVFGVVILIALLAIWLWTMAKAWMGHYVYLPVITFLTTLLTPQDGLIQAPYRPAPWFSKSTSHGRRARRPPPVRAVAPAGSGAASRAKNIQTLCRSPPSSHITRIPTSGISP